MDEGFSLPPGLRMSRPRDVSFTWRGKVIIGLIAVLAVGSVVMFVALSAVRRGQIASAELVANGKSTDAVVVRLWRTGDKNHRPMVSYQFSAGGVPAAGQASIPIARWQTLVQGSVIAIRYAESSPAINHPDGYPPNEMPPFVPPVLAVSMLVPCAILVWAINSERRLLANGVAAAATVVAQTRRRMENGATQLGIKYEFALPNGERRRGASPQGRRVPAVGAQICVLYDPERPKRNKPYPLSLVQPES